MSKGKLIRWTGLAGVVGGILFAVLEVAIWATFGDQPGSVSATSSTWIGGITLLLFASYLLFLALIGLYARQANESGALGVIAFILASLGMSMVIGLFWYLAFILPLEAELAPDYLDTVEATGRVPAGVIFTLGLTSIGWALFGIASLRAKVLPSLPLWILIVAAIVALGRGGTANPPIGAAILSVSLAWLGWWLWSEKQTSAV